MMLELMAQVAPDLVVAAGAGDTGMWMGGGFAAAAVAIVGTYMLKILPKQREDDRADEKARRGEIVAALAAKDEAAQKERESLIARLDRMDERMDKMERVLVAIAGSPEVTALTHRVMRDT